MRSESERSVQRRTSAASLKQQVLVFLAEALPEGWISQPLSPERLGQMAAAGARPDPATTGRDVAADILVISPRGRCHFLFVRAPADRWWDGGPRNVPAEKFTEREMRLARRLRAAGHEARPIWGEKELVRALGAWGCPWNKTVCLNKRREPVRPVAAMNPSASKLRFGSWRGRADA